MLKEPDEKFGKCLICDKPLETNGRRFSFYYENGFNSHVHQPCFKHTKEIYIKMFGEEEGLKKWNHYCELQAKTNTFEYKKEKYGWTKEEFDEFNKTRAVTLENMIKRHGKKEGTEMYKKYCKRQSYAGVTLEYFVEKYGEEEGKKKYEEVNKRKFINLENMIRVHGEEEGRKRYKEFLESKDKYYSKISQELFNAIQNQLKDDIFLYGDDEFCSYNDFIKKWNFYDFTDVKNKIIIEYNGERFHAHSRDDKDFSNPYNPDLTAEEQYSLDENKKLWAEHLGYKVYYIWNDDYLKNKEKTIEYCLKILRG